MHTVVCTVQVNDCVTLFLSRWTHHVSWHDFGSKRQGEPDRRSRSTRRANANVPTMSLNELSTQVETQAGAREMRLCVLPPKPAKDAFAAVQGNTDPMVMHPDERLVRRRAAR